MAQVPESEINRLVGLYRRVVTYLARDFVARVTLDDARVFRLTREATDVLDRLDAQTATWAGKNLARIYRDQRRETAGSINGRGVSLKGSCRARNRAAVDRQALGALATDPQVGFLSSLRAATDGIRLRLKLVRSQARALSAQGRSIDEAIESVGVAGGRTVGQLKRTLVAELASRKKAAELRLRPRAARLGPQHIFSNLANLPYVQAGGASMRLDRYAELVIRVKSRQAATLAQRNALVEHCQGLVMISRNLSKHDDACDLYIGRVFALTKDAAEEWGVPHVDQLPGGGAPFHPHCTHNEVPFFPEMMRESVVERATSWPPKWALGRPWADVARDYKAKGGNAYAKKQNPNLKAAHSSGGRERAVAKNARAVQARRRRKALQRERRRVG